MTSQNIISKFTLNTPLGKMIACCTDNEICLLEFEYRKNLPNELEDIQKLYHSIIQDNNHPLLQILQIQLDEYFNKTRKEFDIPISLKGTEFQVKVWKELLKIPYGQTRTYLQQSKLIANELAVRAVAKANGSNRIAILVPCHRIIGSNGDLIGYAGGLSRKKKLLELEDPNPTLFDLEFES